MDFTDVVQTKIDALRAGRGPRAVAEAAKAARFRAQAAPLIAAVDALVVRLGADAMFRAAFGHADLVLEPRGAPTCLAGSVRMTGRAGNLTFILSEYDGVLFRIDPTLEVLEVLKCKDLSYPQTVSIGGKMTGLDAVMRLAEDHVADFLADVACSPAAHLLGPPPPAERGFGT